MRSRSVTVALSTLLVVVLTVAVVARHDLARPNWEFMPEMNRSQAVQAYELTREFANGRAQQHAVQGTIPRGWLPLHFQANKEEAIRAGEELVNPYLLQQPEATAPLNATTEGQSPPADVKPPEPAQATRKAQAEQQLATSTQRGAALYRIYCVACHGPGGAGDGLVAQRGFPPPPPLPTGKSTQMKDGQLFHILSYGQGSMQSMAAQLDRQQRWDVINYVRSLQRTSQATPSPATPDSPPTVPQTPSSQP